MLYPLAKANGNEIGKFLFKGSLLPHLWDG
jgi:hypothetical protein